MELKTEHQYAVESARINLKKQEVKVREAKLALVHGYAKAKAEFEREYARLKAVVETETIEMERDQAWLALKEADLERGFSTDI